MLQSHNITQRREFGIKRNNTFTALQAKEARAGYGLQPLPAAGGGWAGGGLGGCDYREMQDLASFNRNCAARLVDRVFRVGPGS